MEDSLRTISEEVRKVAGTLDAKSRRDTIDVLRELQYALETPEETMQRLIYSGLTTASIRVSLDLKIFNTLVDAATPLNLAELTQITGTDPILLERILRHQASLGVIRETAPNRFTHSQTTRNLANSDIQAGLKFCADVLDPVYAATPSFLASRAYKNPTDPSDTPFHHAWNTKLPLWDWLADHPDQRAYFNRFMYAQRSSMKDCFSCLSLDQESKRWPKGNPIFVDVGGGTGQQCIALGARWPEMKGRIVLQDLPEVISQVEHVDGIQAIPHDFFTKQPVIGAKYYYLRAIMHDHTDEKCLEILKNITEAMTDGSILLLDEIVMPDTNAEWYITQTDLAMMVQFSAMERTESQWRVLLSKADLEVESITTYTDAFRLSVIAARKLN